MNRKFLARVAGLVAFAACLLLTTQASRAADLVPIKIRLDWAPWGSQAAFYLAQQKGWYRQAGLDVEVADGTGSVSTVQILGSSGEFDLGYAATSAIMIGKERGLPVKIVSEVFRRNDEGLIVADGSKIGKVADLRGKTIAYTAGAMEAPFVDTFLKSGGLTRSDVNLVSVDAASKLNMYAAGRADAAFASVPASTGCQQARFQAPAIQRQRAADAKLLNIRRRRYAGEKAGCDCSVREHHKWSMGLHCVRTCGGSRRRNDRSASAKSAGQGVSRLKHHATDPLSWGGSFVLTAAGHASHR
jgi:TRAP-type uncharacterized transport system substrate-binding protein